MPGKVYIVGAGPGKFELLTLKALKVIEEADVILYDRLVGEEIEEYIKGLPDKEVVYVGKEKGDRGERRQEEINRLMKKHAEEGKTVVRLKGGDPGIFGRLADEMLFLASSGIPFEVVPGVSSVNGVPGCAGIPLTHPELGFGFLVVSGRDTDRLKEIAKSGTIIVLMGGSTSREVASNLIRSGLNPETDVAVIERGSFDDQTVTFSTLSRLASLPANFRSPALMVVGGVVSLARKMNRKI